jgi:phosphoribosyl 1,2-cyclic phosphodiesterase
MKFFIIDDDNATIEIHARLLQRAGHTVTSSNTSVDVVEKIIEAKPDCILCDLILPNFDGIDVFIKLREMKDIHQPIFIIVTGKEYDSDRKRALNLGVDGYLIKRTNSDTFVSDILEIIEGTVTIKFWGVRGTLPVPGEKALRYGGNTSCVTLNIGKKHFFIFDAGTGIKELSNYIIKKNISHFSAKIFITHPHYDHINAFSFFLPLFIAGNEFEIFGASQDAKSIEELISSQIDSVYLPFTIKEFSAHLNFRNLNEEEFLIEDVTIRTMLLNHPGRCLGYRVEYKNKSFCYITDNELYPENDPSYNAFELDRLVQFIKETDVLVIDATYTDEQYAKKKGWGHSSITQVVDVADKAKVKLLCLFHHDPEQSDDDIDLKLQSAKDLLTALGSATRCIAPHEGDKIII